MHNTLKRHSEEAIAKSQETNMQRMAKDHLSELSEKLKKNVYLAENSEYNMCRLLEWVLF